MAHKKTVTKKANPKVTPKTPAHGKTKLEAPASAKYVVLVRKKTRLTDGPSPYQITEWKASEVTAKSAEEAVEIAVEKYTAAAFNEALVFKKSDGGAYEFKLVPQWSKP